VLDSRFSDPAATAATWADTCRVLEEAQLSWICTVRADGRPHLTPLVAVWLDGTLYFSTGEGEQKAVNLRGNPHVLLLTGCSRWDEGLDVVAEGGSRGPGPDGRFEHPGGGPALVFAVRPAKILAFAKGRFGQTRHRPA
jgi:hypothetical protein